MKYKSKTDYGIVLIILLILLLPAGFMLLIHNWLISAFFCIPLALMIYVLNSTFYEISGNDLVIRCGIFVNRKISIQSITSISETNDLSASPANSTDRLKIQFNGTEKIIISPKSKDDFIRQVVMINPQIGVTINCQEI